MSSRNLMKTALGGGRYTPQPTPSSAEQMPVYLNDEFLNLGGLLNNLLGGGLFTPRSEVPERIKEGVCLLFTDKVVKDGVTIIPTPGLYLYFKDAWRNIPFTPPLPTE